MATLVLLGTSAGVTARPDFLSEWKEVYPTSESGNRQCQLCHQHEDGGDGWNPYGFAIRFQFRDVFNFSNIDLAIQAVENFDSDGDPASLNNKQEIQDNIDPGWRTGPVNTIHFKDGTSLNGQLPPFTNTDQQTSDSLEFCVPVLKRKTLDIVVFCL